MSRAVVDKEGKWYPSQRAFLRFAGVESLASTPDAQQERHCGPELLISATQLPERRVDPVEPLPAPVRPFLDRRFDVPPSANSPVLAGMVYLADLDRIGVRA